MPVVLTVCDGQRGQHSTVVKHLLCTQEDVGSNPPTVKERKIDTVDSHAPST